MVVEGSLETFQVSKVCFGALGRGEKRSFDTKSPAGAKVLQFFVFFGPYKIKKVGIG
jgi:hypothetical protein